MTRTLSRSTLRLFVPALLSIALSSCGSDLLNNLHQNWSLTAVRDTTLPYTVPHASQDRVIISGTADLGSDNNYTITFTGTVDGTSAQIGTDHGHWSINSSIFSFHSSTGVDYIAALVGSTFRAAVPGQFVGSSDADFDMLFTKN